MDDACFLARLSGPTTTTRCSFIMLSDDRGGFHGVCGEMMISMVLVAADDVDDDDDGIIPVLVP